jgi:hypothetical protein
MTETIKKQKPDARERSIRKFERVNPGKRTSATTEEAKTKAASLRWIKRVGVADKVTD